MVFNKGQILLIGRWHQLRGKFTFSNDAHVKPCMVHGLQLSFSHGADTASRGASTQHGNSAILQQSRHRATVCDESTLARLDIQQIYTGILPPVRRQKRVSGQFSVRQCLAVSGNRELCVLALLLVQWLRSTALPLDPAYLRQLLVVPTNEVNVTTVW